MNFDNLVEDAEIVGGTWVYDSVSLTIEELKGLVTHYILADRAASGEPVVTVLAIHGEGGTKSSICKTSSFEDGMVNPGDKLYTHAQPTPELEAEIRKEFEVENEKLCAQVAMLTESNENWMEGFETAQRTLGEADFKLDALTAQNAKLMEALEMAHGHMQLYIPQYEKNQNVFDTVTTALIPQPEEKT